MANSTNSLSHTKWLCKYHIVIVPKYRRKIIYNQTRKDLREIIKTLCKYKGERKRKEMSSIKAAAEGISYASALRIILFHFRNKNKSKICFKYFY